MKTKLLLLATVVMLSTSCIKDFIGHSPKDAVLTEYNYLYPDDVKTTFLENENIELSAEINELQSIIDAGQADQETKARYATIKSEFATNNSTINNIASVRGIILKNLPKPPCPKPQNCNGWLDINYLTPKPSDKAFQAFIYDASQNIIAQTEGQPKPLMQSKGLLNYVDLVWKTKNYTGEITVKIILVNQTNQMDAYYISSKIE